MSERKRVETKEYILTNGVSPEDGVYYFYLADKRNRNLTYFHSVNGAWLMRDDVEYDSHVPRRSGRIPEDVDGVVEEQLDYIREHGQMEDPESL